MPAKKKKRKPALVSFAWRGTQCWGATKSGKKHLAKHKRCEAKADPSGYGKSGTPHRSATSKKSRPSAEAHLRKVCGPAKNLGPKAYATCLKNKRTKMRIRVGTVRERSWHHGAKRGI